jgi:hypothetical protein
MLTFPSVEPGDDLAISASTWVTYLRCPDQARARLEGIYGPDSRASFSGGLAHSVFAQHLRDGPIPADEFEDTCKRAIGSSNLNYKLAAVGLKPSTLGGVIHEVQELYDRFRMLPTEGFRGAEQPLEFEPTEGVLLRGTVDAVFDSPDGVRLVDWKTGGLSDAIPQLDFYATLWTLTHHEPPAMVEAISVRTGERENQVPTLSDMGRTLDALAEMVSNIRRIWRARTVAERSAGPWCRFCPILDGCAEGRATIVKRGGES